MTKEAAKREIDSLDFYLQNHTDDYGESSHTAMMMAAKALETENALIDRVLEIIDRLDAEAVEDFELDTDYGLAVVHDRFEKARKKIKALKGGKHDRI